MPSQRTPASFRPKSGTWDVHATYVDCTSPGIRRKSGLTHNFPASMLLHADPHLLAWNKPSGLHTVPAKPPGTQDCLDVRARAAFPDALLVHRLDRDTSGVVLMARTRLAQRHLGWQFERRQVTKVYVARVAGGWPAWKAASSCR